MKRITLPFVALILVSFYAEAFTVSSKSNCYEGGTYAYNFSESSILPDYTVNVSEFAVVPDLTIQIVNTSNEADLILADDLPYYDMAVCNTQSSHGAKTIVLSNSALMPDITVRLSRSPAITGYKIYINSTKFTAEQAAALFAVIWKSRQGN